MLKVVELDLLLVLYFSNWSAWQLIILTNTFLTPKGSAPCLNIWCRKTLDVLINCITEEVAQKIQSISALIVAKNIFDGIVLLLYGNLTTLKLQGFLLSYKNVWIWPSFIQRWRSRKIVSVCEVFSFFKIRSDG